jgi:hypothetical protein
MGGAVTNQPFVPPISDETVLSICNLVSADLLDRHGIATDVFAAIVARNLRRMPGYTGLPEAAVIEFGRATLACAMRIDLLMRGSITSPDDQLCSWVRLDAVRV